jgi:hypothetical protein
MLKTRFIARLFRSAIVALLSFTVCIAEEAQPEQGLPKDVSPLPAKLQDQMKTLMRMAQKYRGLAMTQDVPCGSLGEALLRKKMVQAFQEELPDVKINPMEASLKAFGFIPETMVLSKYYPELLTSQVGGYYDPRRKYLVVVERDGGILGKEAKQLYGEAMAGRMEETVLVHELTHAIQDQYFDLSKFTGGDPMADESAAHLALVEGDATLTMYDYFLTMNIEQLPGLEAVMGQMMKDPKQMIDMSPDMPGAKEMSAAPAWFRDNMLFSYLQGFMFCVSVKKTGGQKLLDYAFKVDPPRSTEQILHPEKWHTNRDDPIEITWPDLAQALPGYTKVKEGQLGEQSIRILLREALKDEPKASEAAAGWGGDRFGVYVKDGKRVLAWITEWDTIKDGLEFKQAAAKLGEDWKVDSPNPHRVTLVRGLLGAAELKSLQSELASAKATAPENKNIDFVKLGIDQPGTGKIAGDNKELEALLKKIAGDKGDLSDMVKKLAGEGKDDPAARTNQKDPKLNEKSKSKDDITDLLNKIAENGGGKDDGSGMDLGSMMKNPMVQSMLKDMMTQDRPAGKTADDGKTYVNEALGISIKAPSSQKDWIIDPKPSIPMASVVITSADGGGSVSVVCQPLPFSVPIDQIAPFLEMPAKMAMKNYKKVASGMITTSGEKGFELEFEGNQEGQDVHVIQHVYLSGGNMIAVQAGGPADAWKSHEKAIRESLDSFTFTPPGSKKKAAAPAPDVKEPLKEDDK